MKTEVEYLRHFITNDVIKVNPNKIKAIMSWKAQNNVKEVQSFLGLCNYYIRFVKDFSTIAAPLTDLIKNDKVLKWGREADASF